MILPQPTMQPDVTNASNFCLHFTKQWALLYRGLSWRWSDSSTPSNVETMLWIGLNERNKHNVCSLSPNTLLYHPALFSFMNITWPVIGCQIITLMSESRPSGGGERVITTHYQREAHTCEHVCWENNVFLWPVCAAVCTQLCLNVCGSTDGEEIRKSPAS